MNVVSWRAHKEVELCKRQSNISHFSSTTSFLHDPFNWIINFSLLTPTYPRHFVLEHKSDQFMKDLCLLGRSMCDVRGEIFLFIFFNFSRRQTRAGRSLRWWRRSMDTIRREPMTIDSSWELKVKEIHTKSQCIDFEFIFIDKKSYGWRVKSDSIYSDNDLNEPGWRNYSVITKISRQARGKQPEHDSIDNYLI